MNLFFNISDIECTPPTPTPTPGPTPTPTPGPTPGPTPPPLVKTRRVLGLSAF